jgi:acyl-[acyl carrier protein]--UDP-N-acetylglucosamine O-acyltransferase
MGHRLKDPVKAGWLAGRLGLTLVGQDRDILVVAPLGELCGGALSFSNASRAFADAPFAVVIAPGSSERGGVTLMQSARPRLDFARALHLIAAEGGFEGGEMPPRIDPTARIGENVVIGPGAQIGAGTRIHHNVVIGAGVRIGRDCVIKSGTVIGEQGFGFERDENGVPIRMLHIGGVVIGDGVELGSLNTVCRGTLHDTVVEDHVKTDDHVHIAHNCHVGRGALLTACAELSGGVVVGAGAWLGPNCSIIQKVDIGPGAFVGIGAVVTRDVPANAKVAGNPARVLPPTQPER